MDEKEKAEELNKVFIDGYKELHRMESRKYIATVITMGVIIVALLIFIFLAYFKPQSMSQEQSYEGGTQSQHMYRNGARGE